MGARLNGEGLRVLAVAVRELPSPEDALQAAADSSGMHGSDGGGGGAADGSPLAPTTPAKVVASGWQPWTPASDYGTLSAAAAAAASSELGSHHHHHHEQQQQRRLCTPEAERGLVFCGFLAFLVRTRAWGRQSCAVAAGGSPRWPDAAQVRQQHPQRLARVAQP